MQRRTVFIATMLVAGLALSGVASADDGRSQRPNGWGQRHAVARPSAAANSTSTVQEGRGNAASVVQTGSANAAGIRQYGRDNAGAIKQVGSGNTACLIQVGRNLNGGIQQVGDNQSNGLLQTRWGSAEIPAETCATATTRGEIMAYAPERPEIVQRGRARGRLRGEP